MVDENTETHRDVLVPKVLRIPRGVVFDLNKIKGVNYKYSHTYVVCQVLNIIIPKVLEQIESSPIIRLDGVEIRL